MAKRVFLHVGSTKTGTTFLQRVLWSHRDRLREQGMLLPGQVRGDHFRACLDVREQVRPTAGADRISGAWGDLVAEIAAWEGDALVSHELFAPATAAQAARAIDMLAPADVHVVLTARDLGRQIPAEWQEHLKHGSVLTFPEFVRAVRVDPAQGPFSPNGYHFWDEQDVPGLAARWGAGLPRERVHVVTLPRAGGSAAVLWGRFTDLIGIDGATFDLGVGRANSSLLAEQAELLRLLNSRLGPHRQAPHPSAELVKTVLAQQILTGRPGTRFGLVGEDRDFAITRAKEMIAGLERLDVDVVGDLAELVPDETSPDVSPDAHAEPGAVLDEAVEALAGVLDRLVGEQTRRRRLRTELDRARAGSRAGRVVSRLRRRSRA